MSPTADAWRNRWRFKCELDAETLQVVEVIAPSYHDARICAAITLPYCQPGRFVTDESGDTPTTS